MTVLLDESEEQGGGKLDDVIVELRCF